MKPLTIAGGGLAGLTLGIGLRRLGVPVAVHEAGSYPRHRVCGEFLNGAARDVLEELGVGDVLSSARRQATSVWFFRGRRIRSFTLPEPAWGLSRFRLDAALGERFVSLGGELREHSRRTPQTDDGTVWCAGRLPVRGRWVGLKCHLVDFPLEADLEMHLGSQGYAGLARIEDGRVNVCGLFRCDRSVRSLPGYLRNGGLTALADRVEAAEMGEGSAAAVAGFALGWQRQRPGVLAVGDASAMIPPFTGNGMSMACEAARQAVKPLAEFARGERTWSSARHTIARLQRHAFAVRLAVARAAHPFLLGGVGPVLLAGLSRLGLLPFRPAFSLMR